MALPFGARLSALMTGFAQGQQQLQEREQALKQIQLREKMMKADLELRQLNAQQAQQRFAQQMQMQQERLDLSREGMAQEQEQFQVREQRLSQQAEAQRQMQQRQLELERAGLGLRQRQVALQERGLELEAKQPSMTGLALRAAGGDENAQKAMDMLQRTKGNQQLSKVGLALQAARGDRDAQKALELLNTGESDIKLTDIRGLRQEFSKLSGDFVKQRDAFDRIEAASVKDSPAGDLALIFGYMKLLDPTSVVREGEQATVQNAAGVPMQVRNLYNRLLTGEKLTPEQREDIVGQSRTQFNAAARSQEALEREIRRIAKESDIDPEKVIIDFLGEKREAAKRFKIE